MSLSADVVLELAVHVKYAYLSAPRVNQKYQIVVHEEVADFAYHTFLCGLQRYNLVFGRKYAVGADEFYFQHAAVVLYLVETLLPLVHQWEGGSNLHSICVRLLVQRGERNLFLCSCWLGVAGIQEHAGQEG